MEESKWLKVYMKESNFKGGKPYGSATRSDGQVVRLFFDEELQLPEAKVFEVSNLVGTPRTKQSKDGKYTNVDYYVNKCDFRKALGEELPI